MDYPTSYRARRSQLSPTWGRGGFQPGTQPAQPVGGNPFSGQRSGIRPMRPNPAANPGRYWYTPTQRFPNARGQLSPAIPKVKPQLGSLNSLSRAGRIALGRANPWFRIADALLEPLIHHATMPARDSQTIFDPGSAYELLCHHPNFPSGHCLSGLYAVGFCFDSQYIHQCGEHVPTAATEYVTEIIPSVPPFPTGVVVRSWHRIAPANSPPVYIPARWEPIPAKVAPMPMPLALPQVIPALDPHSVPPGAPMVQPKPLPYRVVPHRLPNPYRDPVEQTQRGNVAAPSPATPQPVPVQPPPIVLPPVNPVLPGGGSVVVRPPGYKPPFTPPGRGVKERKWIAAVASSSPLGRIVNGVTEGADLVEAFYGALPDYLKGCRTLQCKLAALYEHWDKVNMLQAIANIVANQVEDRIIGGVGSHLGRANRNNGLNRPFGMGIGPAI